MLHTLTGLTRTFLRRGGRASRRETNPAPLTPLAAIEDVLQRGLLALYRAQVPKAPLLETRGEQSTILCMVSGAGPHQRGIEVAAPLPGIYFARFTEGGGFLYQHEYVWYAPDQFGSVAQLLLAKGISAEAVRCKISAYLER